MPLIVTDFNWRQTDAVVIIRVPLKNVSNKNVDIFTLDEYIKAHYAPFLFEIFLWAPVKNAESKCTLTDTDIVFELQKSQHGHWSNLEAPITKDEKKKLRQQYIAKAHEIAQAEKETISKKKNELHHLAVKQQIALDTKERERIEEIKNNEKALAMKDLQKWKESSSTDVKKSESLNPHTECNGENRKLQISTRNEKDKQATAKNKLHLENRSKISAPENLPCSVKEIPAPRKLGTINVSFTPRVFPTPKRESQEKEELEWLKKQYEARRNVGFVEEDLLPEERDPDWLKQKGDSFFQMGNYLGAISAYSHGINLGFRMPALYSNRAAAHIAAGNLHKAIEDCSEALELLTPHVAMNVEARACCHARRAAALCRLGLLPQALADLEAALQLQPDNEKLRNDLIRVRHSIETQTENTSSDDD